MSCCWTSRNLTNTKLPSPSYYKAVLKTHLKAVIVAFSRSHVPFFVYGSSLKVARTSSFVSALTKRTLPVIGGGPSEVGCSDNVAPPKTTWPEAILGFNFSRCCGLASNRFWSAFGLSGTWQSHSYFGVAMILEELKLRREMKDEVVKRNLESISMKRSTWTVRKVNGRERWMVRRTMIVRG